MHSLERMHPTFRYNSPNSTVPVISDFCLSNNLQVLRLTANFFKRKARHPIPIRIAGIIVAIRTSETGIATVIQVIETPRGANPGRHAKRTKTHLQTELQK